MCAHPKWLKQNWNESLVCTRSTKAHLTHHPIRKSSAAVSLHTVFKAGLMTEALSLGETISTLGGPYPPPPNTGCLLISYQSPSLHHPIPNSHVQPPRRHDTHNKHTAPLPPDSWRKQWYGYGTIGIYFSIFSGLGCKLFNSCQYNCFFPPVWVVGSGTVFWKDILSIACMLCKSVNLLKTD